MDHGAAVRRHLPPPLNHFCLPSVTPAPDLLAPSRSHSSLPSSGVFRAPLPTCLSAGGPCSLLASLTPALLLSEQLHPRWGLRYQHHTLMGPKSAPAADTSLRNVTPCSHWPSGRLHLNVPQTTSRVQAQVRRGRRPHLPATTSAANAFAV